MPDTSKPKPPFHPIADIFPEMSKTEFSDLVADIDKQGQLQPIFTYKGLVIDGRNRWLACEKLNLAPMTMEWEGDESELVPFVVGLNLKRRHLDDSQRGMIAAKIETLSQGRPEKDANLHDLPVPRKQAAEMLNVSPRTVADAKVVKDKGVPELVDAVEAGEVSVSAAAVVAKEYEDEPETQKAIVEKGEVKKAAKSIRELAKEKGVNHKAKEIYDSFDRKEASRRIGVIALEIATIVDRWPELAQDFEKISADITDVQQYIFPQCNKQ